MLFGLFPCSKIQRGRGPERLPEHRNERTRCTVARFQSGVRDLSSLRQEAHCLHQAKLLAPLTEGHPHLLLKESFHRSLTSAGYFADLREWTGVARVGDKYLCDSKCPGVGKVRKLQRNHLNGFELVNDCVDQVALPLNTLPQSGKLQACRISSFSSRDTLTTQQ